MKEDLKLDYSQIDIPGFEVTDPYTLLGQVKKALQEGDLQQAKEIKRRLVQLITQMKQKTVELKNKIQEASHCNDLLVTKIQDFNKKLNIINPQEGDKLISFLPDVGEISALHAELLGRLETPQREVTELGRKRIDEILSEASKDKRTKLSSILSDVNDLIEDNLSRERELADIIQEFIKELRVQVRILNFELSLYGSKKVVPLPIFQTKKQDEVCEFIYENFDEKWVRKATKLSISLATQREKLEQDRLKKHVLSYFKETLKQPEYYEKSSFEVDLLKVLRHVRTWEPSAQETEIRNILKTWSGTALEEKFHVNVEKIGLEPEEKIEEEKLPIEESELGATTTSCL